MHTTKTCWRCVCTGKRNKHYMTTITRYRGRTGLAISFIAALALAVPVHSAQAASMSALSIVPPATAQTVTGNTYGAWSAAWWRYVALQPAATNPVVDTKGVNCGVGQLSTSPVFFLVGSFGSDPVTRTCTVPAGKALFFPLINTADVHTPGDSTPTDQLLWNEMEVTRGFSISDLHASIDGVPVSNLNPAALTPSPAARTPYRTCAGPVSRCSAPAFSLTLPQDNVFGLPEGTYGPAVADGVYLMLAPLSAGRHTITFGGTGSSGFSQDITYNLVVSSS
jgi:hypothetical protein